jgi:hypothetical protein
MSRDRTAATDGSAIEATDGGRSVTEARAAIDDHLGDGGGCTEAWEALTQARAEADERSPDADRRGVLKGLAAAGITAIGMTGTASAQTGGDGVASVPESEVESILSDPIVERVIADTGVENVRREAVVKSDPDDDHSTVVYSFPTPVGVLFYGDRDGQTEAGVSFGYSLDDGYAPLTEAQKRDLDASFHSLPNAFATYTVTDPASASPTPVQIRHLTDAETAHVARKLETDPASLTGVVSSDRDDIVVFDTESERKRYLTGFPDDAPFEEMSAKEIAATEEIFRFTTAGNCNDMLGTCAATQGTTAACILGCVTAGVSTWGAAFALCAICTGGTAFNAGIQCGQWYDQCV